MRRVLGVLLLATFALTGCGGTSSHPKAEKLASTVRYLCFKYTGDTPSFGTAKRASDGTWSIQMDTDPSEPPLTPTQVGKDLVANLSANGCRVFKTGDPTTGLSPGCPPRGTKQPVTMPNLIGMDYASGSALLNVRKCAAGDTVDVQARSHHLCKGTPGTFVRQSPKPGTVLGTKTQIWIHIDAGPPCKKGDESRT